MTKVIMMGLLSLSLGGQMSVGMNNVGQTRGSSSVKVKSVMDPDGGVLARQWEEDGQVKVFLTGLKAGIEERYTISEGQVPPWESSAIKQLELLYPIDLKSEDISVYLQRDEVLLCGIDEAVVDEVIRDGEITYGFSNWKGLQPKYGEAENWLYLVDEVLTVSHENETCDLLLNEHVFMSNALDKDDPIYLGIRGVALPGEHVPESVDDHIEEPRELNL